MGGEGQALLRVPWLVGHRCLILVLSMVKASNYIDILTLAERQCLRFRGTI